MKKKALVKTKERKQEIYNYKGHKVYIAKDGRKCIAEEDY